MASNVFRFPNLAAVRAHLHGAGYRYLEDLSEEEHRRRPDDPRHQPLGLTRAALNSGVRDREDIFRAAGCPPSVFISYRWESPEIIEWAQSLARHIEGRGFHVRLDQDAEALQDNDPVEIGHYISGIVECSYVVCLCTPQYVAGLDPRAWLFEERQLMNLLARRGALIVRLRLDGWSSPAPAEGKGFDLDLGLGAGVAVEVQVADHPGITIDMRGPAVDRFDLLDPILHYSGPRFPAAADAPFRAWLNDVAQALDADDAGLAAARYARGADYTSAPEARRLGAHIAHSLGDTDKAVRLASTVAVDPGATPESLLDIALLLHDTGQQATALHALARLPSWLGEEWSWLTHMHQGDLLDDLGSPIAALAHLRYALALSEKVTIDPRPRPTQLADLHSTIGYVLLFSFAAPDAAQPHLQIAWQDKPGAANAVNLLLCHAAAGDHHAAERLWRTVAPTLTAAEQARFSEIPERLAARALDRPTPRASLPGVGPDWWSCPRCDSHLLMGEATSLCAGCATAFRGARCPCCGETQVAGGGITTTDEHPPRCPICKLDEPMHRFRR